MALDKFLTVVGTSAPPAQMDCNVHHLSVAGKFPGVMPVIVVGTKMG